MRPLRQIPPTYPPHLDVKGIEGWVLLEFDVEPDGTPSHIQVVDAEPQAIFDAASILAVSNWRYPAIADRNISRHFQVEMEFYAPGSRLIESRNFKKKRKEIEDAINDGDLATAELLLPELRNNEASFRIKRYYQAYFEYAIALEKRDLSSAQRALQRTLDSGDLIISRGTRKMHLRQLFLIEARLGYYSLAVAHHEDLQNYENLKRDKEITPFYLDMKSILDGPHPALYKMQIERTCLFCQRDELSVDIIPYRDEFQIQNIVGELTNMTVQCDDTSEFYLPADPIHFRLPEKGKDCHISIFGTPGTTFDLLEFWSDPINHQSP